MMNTLRVAPRSWKNVSVERVLREVAAFQKVDLDVWLSRRLGGNSAP